MKKYFILIGCCMILSGCSNHTSESMEKDYYNHEMVTVDDQADESMEEEDKWNQDAVTVNYFEGTFDTVEEFELIELKPYVISEGQLFWGENDQWNLYSYDGRIIKIFEDSRFCALDDRGKIVVEENPADIDTSQYPLLGQGIIYHAQLLMEVNQSRSFQTISKSIFCGFVVVLCEDGELITIYDDYARVIPFSEDVKDLSGNFILTQNGDVYMWEYYDENGKIRCNLVSSCPIVKIAAGRSSTGCIGICEDGSLVKWPTTKYFKYFEELDLSEWKNITSLKVGEYGSAGLSEDGRVYFAAYDEKTEEAVNAFLEGRTASAIACSYHILALLQEDRSVVMIDLNRIGQID